MHLRRAMIFAKDMARMTAFYRDLLGLPHLVERSRPGWEELEGLALHELTHIDVEDPPRRREDCALKLVFGTDDVRATRERLIAAGVTMDATFEWEGRTFCDGVDPEGNVFQISSGP
jgi:predicted enzyme related to lactoylglutathione lyase